MVERPAGDLLVAANTADDSLYFFAPYDDAVGLVGRLTLPAGQGPYGLASATVGAATYVFATTFFDHGLVAIDVSAPEVRAFHVQAQFADPSFPVARRSR